MSRSVLSDKKEGALIDLRGGQVQTQGGEGKVSGNLGNQSTVGIFCHSLGKSDRGGGMIP